MPILFCERCGRETEWVYHGSDTIYCKSCDWQMSAEEFRTYRRKIILEELRRMHRPERNPIDELYDELEDLVQSDEKIAEEVHIRNMKQLEKLVNKATRRRKKTYVLGEVIS